MFIRLIASIRDPFFIFFHPFEQRLPRERKEEEIKGEEEELDFIDRKILWNSMILVSLV